SDTITLTITYTYTHTSLTHSHAPTHIPALTLTHTLPFTFTHLDHSASKSPHGYALLIGASHHPRSLRRCRYLSAPDHSLTHSINHPQSHRTMRTAREVSQNVLLQHAAIASGAAQLADVDCVLLRDA